MICIPDWSLTNAFLLIIIDDDKIQYSFISLPKQNIQSLHQQRGIMQMTSCSGFTDPITWPHCGYTCTQVQCLVLLAYFCCGPPLFIHSPICLISPHWPDRGALSTAFYFVSSSFLISLSDCNKTDVILEHSSLSMRVKYRSFINSMSTTL